MGCLCVYGYQVLKIIKAITPPPMTTTPIISHNVISELVAAFVLVGTVGEVLVLLLYDELPYDGVLYDGVLFEGVLLEGTFCDEVLTDGALFVGVLFVGVLFVGVLLVEGAEDVVGIFTAAEQTSQLPFLSASLCGAWVEPISALQTEHTFQCSLASYLYPDSVCAVEGKVTVDLSVISCVAALSLNHFPQPQV